jgi:hypothetical protein
MLDRGLATYPQEARLIERKAHIEGEIRKREEEQLRLREQEFREEQQRAQARALEPARWKPVAPAPEDVSATRLFAPGMNPATAGVSARTASPVSPPAALSQSHASAANHDLPTLPISSSYSVPMPVTPGPADVPGSTKGQALRDATLPESDPRAAAPAPDVTHIQPGIGSDDLNENSLRIIERQLAAFIGPLAKVLVKRAASKTTNTLELYTLLAASLEREADRKSFLARSAELSRGKAPAASAAHGMTQAMPTLGAPVEGQSSSEITAAAIEQAARKLATHLGPIAAVLARKDAKRAATLRDFYSLLAEHVVNPAERERFLKEAGGQ